jgi:glycosyltransferase involved in cell wall biosynthesis
MDAMACGLPAACPDGRAFVDFIRDGVTGFMYDATPKGCAEAIRKCLTADPSVGVNARRTAEEYSISGSIDAYVSLFEELIDAKRRK